MGVLSFDYFRQLCLITLQFSRVRLNNQVKDKMTVTCKKWSNGTTFKMMIYLIIYFIYYLFFDVFIYIVVYLFMSSVIKIEFKINWSTF